MMELTVFIALLGIITVVIGWLVVSIFNLNKEITKLSGIISGLNATILSQDNKIIDVNNRCAEHRKVINDRLEKHGLQIDDLKLKTLST